MENNSAPVEVGSLSQGLYIPWNDDDLRTGFPSHLMELFQKITFFAKENSLDFILYIHQVAVQQVLFFPLIAITNHTNVSWNILEWSSYKSHGIFIFRFHDWLPIPRGFFQSWLIPTPHRIHVSDVYYVHLPTFAWLILASFCWFGNYPSGNDHISRKEPFQGGDVINTWRLFDSPKLRSNLQRSMKYDTGTQTSCTFFGEIEIPEIYHLDFSINWKFFPQKNKVPFNDP